MEVPREVFNASMAVKGLVLKTIWDTGAMFSSHPTKKDLEMIRRIYGVELGGVTGEKMKLKLMGTYYPKGMTSTVGLPCLWVPGSPYAILSISQMARELKAHAYFNETEAFIWTKDGVLAHAEVHNGLYFQSELRPEVTLDYLIKKIIAAASRKRESKSHTVFLSCNQTIEHLRFLHNASNHKAYSTLRKIYNYPPADKDNPDPLCPACCEAEMQQPRITQSSAEEPTRPWQFICLDISRKKPADRRGNQRYIMAACMYTDAWMPIVMKRKSDALAKLEQFIQLIHNKYAPYKISVIKCDYDSNLAKMEGFKELCAKYGIHWQTSPPNHQEKNPAENVMRRAQREERAIMFASHMVPGSWTFAIHHVAHVHNAMERPGRLSPHEEATGIKPRWKPTAVFGSKVMAKLYNKGKLEPHAVESVYLGHDSHCNADIVRPYNSRLASGMERYALVTRHESDVIPYSYPTVPRPRPYPSQSYDSDSDVEDEEDDGDEGEIVSSLSENLLASGPEANYETKAQKKAESKAATELKLPEQLEQPNLPDMIASAVKGRPRKMSLQAMENWQRLHAHMAECLVDTAKYYYSGLSQTYEPGDREDAESTDPQNPFLHLFNPETDTLWEDPKTLKQMYAHRMKEYFIEAMLKERDAWRTHKVYHVIKKEDIPIDPKTGQKYKIMSCQPVWKTKLKHDKTIDKFKYRLCVNGKYQDKTKALCYEPMVSIPSLKLFFDLVVRFDLKYRKTDAQEFFLNFKVRDGERYYMQVPPGWHPELDSKVYCLSVDKAVYGIPTATQTAGSALNAHLCKEMGFAPCVHDERVYFKWHTETDISVILVHVDDCLVSSTKDVYLDEITKGLNSLCITIESKPDKFRGVEIVDSAFLPQEEQSDSGDSGRWIILKQEGFIKDMQKEFKIDANFHPTTPCPEMSSAEDMVKPIQASQAEVKNYMKAQGCLQWCVLTVPACNFTINWLSRHMQNPQPRHVQIQKQCMTYICHRAAQGCTFRRVGPPHKLRRGYLFDDLEGAADATWVDRQQYPAAFSTTGYVYKTSMGTVLYGTSKQNNVTTSSCEAEVMANKKGCQQGIWLRGLITDLGFGFSKPTPILQDNQSAIHSCNNDGHHKNSRHFRVACHYLKELVDRRIFCFKWTPSAEMYADVMTKALNKTLHAKHEATLVNAVA